MATRFLPRFAFSPDLWRALAEMPRSSHAALADRLRRAPSVRARAWAEAFFAGGSEALERVRSRLAQVSLEGSALFAKKVNWARVDAAAADPLFVSIIAPTVAPCAVDPREIDATAGEPSMPVQEELALRGLLLVAYRSRDARATRAVDDVVARATARPKDAAYKRLANLLLRARAVVEKAGGAGEASRASASSSETGLSGNLKLAVLDALARDEKITLPDAAGRGFEPDERVRKKLLAVEVPAPVLASMRSLSWEGGGHAIVHRVWEQWDGEDGAFDVESLAGIEQLSGLETLSLDAVEPLDLAPLRGVPGLREVSLDAVFEDVTPLLDLPRLTKVRVGFIDTASNREVMNELRRRGVDVESEARG
jgi:hypothetical protein